MEPEKQANGALWGAIIIIVILIIGGIYLVRKTTKEKGAQPEITPPAAEEVGSDEGI